MELGKIIGSTSSMAPDVIFTCGAQRGYNFRHKSNVSDIYRALITNHAALPATGRLPSGIAT
jgi:hypothetical protein